MHNKYRVWDRHAETDIGVCVGGGGEVGGRGKIIVFQLK